MDALSLLKSDHRTVESLFKRFEASKGASQEKEEVCRQIVRELSVHAAIEEEAFYPTIKPRSKELEELVLEALEEHHVAKWLLSELEKMTPDDERLGAKMNVLAESVRHHVREEEQELFPKVRQALSAEELSQLGRVLAGLKTTSPTHPHPRAPDEPPGNLIAGAVATVLDAGKDLLAGLARKSTTSKPGRGPAATAKRGRLQQLKSTASKRRRAAASAKVARRPRR